jgi:hypothetical protein
MAQRHVDMFDKPEARPDMCPGISYPEHNERIHEYLDWRSETHSKAIIDILAMLPEDWEVALLDSEDDEFFKLKAAYEESREENSGTSGDEFIFEHLLKDATGSSRITVTITEDTEAGSLFYFIAASSPG